jgi:hypothetical protein
MRGKDNDETDGQQLLHDDAPAKRQVTAPRHCGDLLIKVDLASPTTSVMRGLEPRIHDDVRHEYTLCKTATVMPSSWIAGSSPAMTNRDN